MVTTDRGTISRENGQPRISLRTKREKDVICGAQVDIWDGRVNYKLAHTQCKLRGVNYHLPHKKTAAKNEFLYLLQGIYCLICVLFNLSSTVKFVYFVFSVFV